MSKFKILILFLLVIKCVNSKVFKKCELAEELIKNQNLSLTETRKLLCILREDNLDTAANGNSFYGIFKIGSTWWCGSNGVKGGGCDIKCEDLIDDDISDDVACARKILNQIGIDAWRVSGESCLNFLNEFLPQCPLEDFQKDKISTTEKSILLSTLTTTTLEGITTTKIDEEILNTTTETEEIETTTEAHNEDEEPIVIMNYESYKTDPNLVFNIFSFNISGHNHKIEYQL
ncbi:hypothetical protein PVAND_008896 [Polypedilum vanderplanki]|uniref:lysozyme n=1 Tax=Polypedilum vanderplanki TaxID=319348 RepID=A0A9J6CC55_POLVA|nr:hypothetical protein PVAND_008896 [Polypedilum vanderplanki]